MSAAVVAAPFVGLTALLAAPVLVAGPFVAIVLAGLCLVPASMCLSMCICISDGTIPRFYSKKASISSRFWTRVDSNIFSENQDFSIDLTNLRIEENR